MNVGYFSCLVLTAFAAALTALLLTGNLEPAGWGTVPLLLAGAVGVFFGGREISRLDRMIAELEGIHDKVLRGEPLTEEESKLVER